MKKISQVNILAVAGSLRENSYNRWLLSEAKSHSPREMRIDMYDDLGVLPLFNEDTESIPCRLPETVASLRRKVAYADGILISTPEYNQSIPGVLKNAIDWISRPAPDYVLTSKPVAVVGASSGPWGTRLAQSHLRHVLYSTGAAVMPSPSLFVSMASNCFDLSGHLTNDHILNSLNVFLRSFHDWIAQLK